MVNGPLEQHFLPVLRDFQSRSNNILVNHCHTVVRTTGRLGKLCDHRKVPRRSQLKCDGTRAETRFRLSVKRTNLFKSAGASVQSTTGSRGVRISCSHAGYTIFRGSVKGTGYPLHSPVSPSLSLPRVTACHHI